MQVIKVGTRGSLLARTQTEQTIERLKELLQAEGIDVRFEMVIIQTTGDRVLDVSLSKVGGKGLFTKEIESALFERTIDLAVHSMKDVPFEMDHRLTIAAIPIREDARDAWLSDCYSDWHALPEGATVGTSSLRRLAALKNSRPDVKVLPLRGNVDTRYQKMKQGEFDAILLAAAGLHRLGWKDRIRSYVPIHECVPAVGQGALALQTRSDDHSLIELLQTIHHPDSANAVFAERSLMAELEGSCQVPIGAYASMDRGNLTLTGFLSMVDGSSFAHISEVINCNDYSNAESFSLALIELGKRVAWKLKQSNQGQLWESIKGGIVP